MTKETGKDEIANEASLLLESNHFFQHHLDALQRNGLVGEERNATILLDVGVSRLLDRPLNVVVKAESSAGKNHLVNQVLRLFPKDAVREITSTSAQAWHYSGDDFCHKVVYLQERNESSGAIHPARQLISEGHLIRTTTVKSRGSFETKRFVAKGPIASISTTTKNQLEIDDETRLVSLWLDGSRKQTRRILQAAFALREPLSKREVRIWRRAHRLLEARSHAKFILPSWLPLIADEAYDKNIRMRRYFNAFASGTKAIALIRSFLPSRYDRKEKTIEIQFSDFAIAAILFEPVFVESLHRGADETDQTRAIVERLARRKRESGVSATDVAGELHITKDKAYGRLREATDEGVIFRCNKPEKGNKKLFLPTPRPRFVPDPEDLFCRIPEIGRKVKFVHPITGKWITYRRKG